MRQGQTRAPDHAERLRPGSATYKLACIAGLRGLDAECQKWLEQCLALAVLPGREMLMADDDLRSVRETDWFRDFLTKAYPT